MKSNFFKYIFIIFVVCIIIYAVYTIYFQNKDKSNETKQEDVIQEEIQIKDLRLGISNFDTINPLFTNNKEVININKIIFEPLMYVDKDYKIQMCLAKECSKTSDTSYVIKIDNNIKWQDGTALIAKDIQFTIDRLKEGKSIYSYNVEKVIGVEILDTDKVKINLSEEVPFFEYNLTFPILSNNYYLGEDFNSSQKIPMGTGMFKISKIEESNIELQKNDKWWNLDKSNSKVETLNIKIYSEMGEVFNAFKLGNIDILNTSTTDIENYIGTIGYSKTEIKGRNYDYLAFNCQDEILQNVEVRKAISYAIDKENIISSVYNNKYTISDFPLDFGSYVCSNTNANSGYNVEQAKKVLTDNEWIYKNNKWQKTVDYKTTRLSLIISVNSTDENRVAVAQNIKEQLESIGIKVTISKLSDAQYKNVLKNKNYQILLTGIYNSYSPDITQFFNNDNLQNYTNEEINKLLNEVKTITDDKLIQEKYEKIQEIYSKEQPFIGLYRNKNIIVKSQNIAGEVIGNNYCSYYNINNWYRM